MKTKSLVFAAVLVFLLTGTFAYTATAQTTPTSGTSGNFCTGGTCTYQALEPLPGVAQTGTVDFGAFVSGVFRLLFWLAGILAIGLLVFGGISYMTSEIVTKKFNARERIVAAFYGLGLLLISYLILFTINPKLVSSSLSFTATQSQTQGGTRATITPLYGQYGAESETGRAIQSNLGSRTLTNVSGVSVVTVSNENASSPAALNAIQNLSGGCASAGGTIDQVKFGTNDSSTAYLCTR